MESEKKPETTKKLPRNIFTGQEGNTFTADNQPDPALKSAGWQKRRSERLLTQGIIKLLIGSDKGDKPLHEYIKALHTLAKKGNPKAIETINRGIEDDIVKVSLELPSAIRIIRDKDV